ncbi:hypothetical protein HPB47_010103 [Ixodes persulcatus]|uniref:Uncharacterized protein n=1 Tax=Ixodes persulcatus TaxID=34615 RepID=A0AC60P060_IXOPE|nr:hypothetical protein HPB47_010103 [Ixodes persulcatus]
MNILILGVDMTLRLNFNLYLLATVRFVRETLNVFELFGYNKAGDKSFPNEFLLLSGLSKMEALARAESYFLTIYIVYGRISKETDP